MARKRRSQPRLTIKSIKARGYTPAYEKRLISAVRRARKAGKKPTRQLARGHKPKEHIVRKERELKKHGGITSQQVKAIQSFIARFNANGYKDIPTEEDLVEFVRERGYDAFVGYRKIWDAARRTYVAELADGTWESRGMCYLYDLTGRSKVHPQGNELWLYYH